MPLDEKWSYIATGLFKALPREVQENTFVMPMFSEWQMATKNMVIGHDLPLHWNVATLGTIIKAREMYQLQDIEEKDFLLIGNIRPDFEFDAIFNFQDAEVDLPYEDKYVEKLREVFADEIAITNNLEFYDASASKMTLHDFNAAAEFLASYLKTDPHLDEIKEKYKNTLRFKEGNADA